MQKQERNTTMADITKIMLVIIFTAILLLAPVFARAGDTQMPQEAQVPIIMYHSLLAKNTNEWNIFPEAFEKDLRYLSENGYTAVFISDLIDYVNEGKPLPEKPIVLTFDDGYYNNYSQGMPLLEQYDMKMVLSVIGSSSDHWTRHPDETDER